MTVPMILTLSRLAILPLFFVLMILPFSWAIYGALVIFVSAALTDFLDGFLARQLGQTSDLGAFLDPVADKLLTLTALIMLVFVNQLSIVALLAALCILWREVGIMALRQAMAQKGHPVEVTWIAKVKTAVQFLAITLLLLAFARGDQTINIIGQVLLVVAAALTMHSFVGYVQAALPFFKDRPKDTHDEDMS
jgi:CDP-diacylglycerol--glycerol-3-phosphate 3-phosphatidyltransferase